MNSTLRIAAASVFLLGLGVSSSPAQQKYYNLSVEVMGTDGGRQSIATFKCPLYEPCQNSVPVTIDGKPVKMGVRSRLADEHHLQVQVQGGGLWGEAFDDQFFEKGFEPGLEWATDLVKTTTTKHVNRQPGKPVTAKDITGETVRAVKAKVRFRLES